MTTTTTPKKQLEKAVQSVLVAGSAEEMLETARVVGYGFGVPDLRVERERDIARIIQAGLWWEL